MRIALVLLFCFVSSWQVLGQKDVSFRITDKNTGEPIINVFVFLENTSIGTTTDLDGVATLSLKSDEFYTIVITHIIYESQSISSDLLKAGVNEIVMTEKLLSLAEVTIRSKKVNQRKRKRWLKRFETALFGPKVSRKKVKLDNPEVLWFEENDTLLIAHAVDNLKITNKETGYEMQFVLEGFTLNVNEDVKYSGKLFFKDIKDTFKRKSRIEKKRDENFMQSQLLFFKSLVNRHPVNETHFEFGITSEKSDSGLVYNEARYNDLYWRYGLDADTLLIDDYFTIINKDQTIRNFNEKSLDSRFDIITPTSFLRSSTGRFIISRDGVLVNQKEIEEFGYWTTVRMAKDLPRNFEGPIIFNDASPKVVIEKLLDYQYNFKSEKVYIHTDKLRYMPYNTMWFKGYIVDAINHTSDTESEVLYVELINEEDKVIKTWMLHKNKSLHGDYTWKASDIPGQYRLRAFTSYMRNHGSEYFFEKEIEFQKLSTEEIAKQQELPDTLSVSFYPEGGDLIAGVKNDVTFQVSGQNGVPLDISGEVIDETGSVVTAVQTIHRGLGRFSMIPEREGKYFLEILEGGEKLQFPLPESLNSGFVLSVNPSDEHEIYVTVNASQDALMEGAFLVGHVRGSIFSFVTDIKNGQNFKFDKSDIAPGLIHFTLFDAQERPHAERLVFNDFAYNAQALSVGMTMPDSSSLEEREIVISLDSSFIGEQLDMSVGVGIGKLDVDKGFTAKNYLLLESDMISKVPEKNYYLSDINSAKRFHLDLILRCSHWRRFIWKDILKADSIQLDFLPEKGYSVSGYTSEKERTKRVRSQIMITALGPELIYDRVISNKDGVFSFDGLTPMDSTTYVVQGWISDGSDSVDDEVIKVDGNRLLDIHIDDFVPSIPVYDHFSFYNYDEHLDLSDDALFEIREQYLTALESDSSFWSLEAPDVTISSTRPYTTNRPMKGTFVNMDNADWVNPNAQGPNLLSSLAPLRRYTSGPEGKLYSIFTDFQGRERYVPIIIVIDGMGYEPGGSNAQRLLGLSADEIETIYIGEAYVEVRTRSIPRSLEKYLDSGILHLYHPGYTSAREFSKDKVTYDHKYVNSTVLWQPNVEVDEKGKASLFIKLPADFFEPIYIDVQGVTQSGEVLSLQKSIEHSNANN